MGSNRTETPRSRFVKRLVLAGLVAVGAFGVFRIWQEPGSLLAADSALSLPPMDPRVADKAKVFEPMLSKALQAYNAADAKTFFADFSATAMPIPTAENYQAVYEGFYKATLGKFVAGKLNLRETVPDPDYALVVWTAQFEKAPFVRVSANFVRENKVPKIVQVRMEKLETAPK